MVRRIVIDASVVAKWYINEDWREKSILLRDDYIEGKVELIAPSIMPFEVLNAIRYSRRKISIKTLEDIAESLSLYNIKLYNLIGDYAKNVSRISLKYNVSIYDASYIALAIQEKTLLYTADKKLINVLNGEILKYIRHISQYKLNSKYHH